MNLPDKIAIDCEEYERGLGTHVFNVTYTRPLLLRLWLGLALLRAGAFILGMKINIRGELR